MSAACFCNNDDRKIVESRRGHRELHRRSRPRVCLTSARSPRSLRNPFGVFLSFIQDSFFLSPMRSRARPFSLPFSVRPSPNQSIWCRFSFVLPLRPPDHASPLPEPSYQRELYFAKITGPQFTSVTSMIRRRLIINLTAVGSKWLLFLRV